MSEAATIPALPALPQSHQAVEALIDEARRRQDQLTAQVGALADDRQALEARLRALQAPRAGHGGDDTTNGDNDDAGDDGDDGGDGAEARGLLASLRQRLQARRRRRQRASASKASRDDPRHSESSLRARLASALAETKKAAWLADRFAALREELELELGQLRALSTAASTRLAELSAQIVAARVGEGAGHDSDDVDARDRAARDRAAAERQERGQGPRCERLAVLSASARGVIDVIDALHADVDAFAAAAARHTDALSAKARAIGVAEDARSVLEELDAALLSLGGSLDEASIFAAAVSARMKGSVSTDPGFGASLETLVHSAMARRAATDAREKAEGQSGSP